MDVTFFFFLHLEADVISLWSISWHFYTSIIELLITAGKTVKPIGKD